MTKWPMVPLGEVITQVRTATQVYAEQEYPNFGIYSFGRGLFAKPPISGATTSARSLYQVQAGQFIYSRLFAFEGAYGLVSHEFDGSYISNEYPHFDCNRRRVSPEFLATYFKWRKAWERAAKLSTGMGDRRRRIQPEQLVKMTIPLPPLKEQQRLVEYFDSLRGKVDEAKSLRQDATRESTLMVGRAVAETFERGKNSGWPQSSLGAITVDVAYGTSEKTSDDDSATPIIRMGNIQDGQLDLNKLKYLHVDPSLKSKLLLFPGDILVNRTNSADLVGKCCVFRLEGEYGYASYIIRLRINQLVATPEFVAHFINSPIGRAYMVSEKKQMTGQANVNSATLRAMPIWLPPRDQQDTVVNEIEQLRTLGKELSGSQGTTSLQLDAVLPSVLHRIFNGDEP